MGNREGHSVPCPDSNHACWAAHLSGAGIENPLPVRANIDPNELIALILEIIERIWPDAIIRLVEENVAGMGCEPYCEEREQLNDILGSLQYSPQLPAVLQAFSVMAAADDPDLVLNDFAEMFYAVTDHLGAPRLIMDADQQPVWSAYSNPFGSVDFDVEDVTMNLRFPGQYADLEAGVYQNWWRDYEPTLGRYLQSDPIGLAGGLNTYSYVWQSPANYIDINGLLGGPFGPLNQRGLRPQTAVEIVRGSYTAAAVALPAAVSAVPPASE